MATQSPTFSNKSLRQGIEALGSTPPTDDGRAAQAGSLAGSTAAGEAYRTRQRPGVAQIAAAQAGVAGAEGAAQVKGAQERAAAETNLDKLALQSQAAAQEARASSMGIGLSQEQRSVEDRLANLSMSLKRQLVDDQMKFARDENGRTVFNTRQQADLAVTIAKDAEELATYQQIMDQASKKKISMLQHMHNKLKQTLQNGTSEELRELEQLYKVDIYRAEKEVADQIAAAKAEAANKSAMWGGLLGVVGAVAGASGGPTGVTTGATIGAGLGEGISDLI